MIEAMKQALDWFKCYRDKSMSRNNAEALAEEVEEALRTAIEQMEKQEPVAWVVEDEHGERLEWAGDAHSCHGLPTFPLYTTPPAAQRQWVSLTKEDAKQAILPLCVNEGVAERLVEVSMDEYHAIEAKLREKNGGQA